MQLSIKTNFPDVMRRLDGLQKDVMAYAMPSGINKTLTLARTHMTREISGEFNVTAKYVRERLRLRGAKRGSVLVIEGALIGGSDKGRSANIIAFVERKVTLAQARKRKKAGTLNQLHVKVKRKGATKPIKGAFIGNKGRTVFIRDGKARLPIKPVQVIDVGQMFNTKRINAAVIRAINERFPDVMEREIRFFTERFNRGGR